MASVEASERIYEDFEPASNLIAEEGCDTLLLYLDGFIKERLKVQLTASGFLRVLGECPVGGNKWKRFRKEFHIPTNCDTNGITAKFENGILYIRQPKLIITPIAAPSQQQNDKGKPTEPALMPQPRQETPRPQPQPEPQPQARTQQEVIPPQARAPEPQHQKLPKKEVVSTKGSDQGKIDEVERSKDRQERAQRINKAVGGGGGFFKELMKPENVNMLVVSVIGVLVLGFYIVYMFKSLTGNGELSNLENSQEL